MTQSPLIFIPKPLSGPAASLRSTTEPLPLIAPDPKEAERALREWIVPLLVRTFLKETASTPEESRKSKKTDSKSPDVKGPAPEHAGLTHA